MAKIATFNPKIGYPDKWKDYSHVGNPAVAPSLRTRLREENSLEQDDRLTIGKPVDRGRLGHGRRLLSDAYYNPLLN